MRPRIPAFLLFCLLLGAALTPAQTNSSNSNASRLFERGMNALTGTGPSHNNLEAVGLIRRSAELGYVPAQTVMGYFPDTGTIVAKEPGEAVEWYRKAAQQGDPLGQWLLGRAYYIGGGVPRDSAQAATWVQKAATQDDPFGQYLLGQIKLERNEYAPAAGWFRKAAMHGLPQAQQQLGLLLKQGRGVTQDKFEAYIWLLLSLQAGNQSVSSDLAQLEAEIGSTQVEEAKSQARELGKRTLRVIAARGCTGWPGEFDAIPAPPPPEIQRFCR